MGLQSWYLSSKPPSHISCINSTVAKGVSPCPPCIMGNNLCGSLVILGPCFWLLLLPTPLPQYRTGQFFHTSLVVQMWFQPLQPSLEAEQVAGGSWPAGPLSHRLTRATCPGTALSPLSRAGGSLGFRCIVTHLPRCKGPAGSSSSPQLCPLSLTTGPRVPPAAQLV